MSEPPVEHIAIEPELRSQLGLDRYETWWQKAIVTAWAGGLGALLSQIGAAFLHVIQPPWRWPAFLVIELLAGCLVLALVYLWWRPPAVQRMYLFVEQQIMQLVRAIGVVALVVAVLLAVVILVQALRG